MARSISIRLAIYNGNCQLVSWCGAMIPAAARLRQLLVKFANLFPAMIQSDKKASKNS
ncbi:MAG: hypothetical protein OXE80_08745 [Gammaproteobacteria bacterium]|nr:hypothetical protein [Gammaproteobacteria bacterium]MCY4270244.1 hypothetical protein [Gammaproteobacteria bacterium]MCY4297636.1 hypothetical protein [Gammaproteobacteria bacterium]